MNLFRKFQSKSLDEYNDFRVISNLGHMTDKTKGPQVLAELV
jgi:hypothetical protein